MQNLDWNIISYEGRGIPFTPKEDAPLSEEDGGGADQMRLLSF